MVLSDKAIKKAIEKGALRISPFHEDQVEAAHINLHLGECEAAINGEVIIPPKGFILARTQERITMSSDLCGLIEGRSRLAQEGVSIEQSSTFIEPNSEGTMVLEIFNASDRAVRLVIGQKIAKVIILRITNEI